MELVCPEFAVAVGAAFDLAVFLSFNLFANIKAFQIIKQFNGVRISIVEEVCISVQSSDAEARFLQNRRKPTITAQTNTEAVL